MKFNKRKFAAELFLRVGVNFPPFLGVSKGWSAGKMEFSVGEMEHVGF